ncbi:hypothetical protein JXL21_11845, partial [Candidatus Bathyarchaeota archaeon]|nr:hypothetical protein [Candidatus Bathyarchaeota archaeon]
AFDDGWLPIESEATETHLIPLDGRGGEMQLQCRLVAGNDCETLQVSRPMTLEAQRRRLCIGVEGEGRTSPEGELAVAVGGEASVTAYPSMNSTFSHWTLNGKHYSSDQTTTVTVEADVNLTAVFTEPLSPSLERVPGVEPGPTPWLEAPEGKVKLTIIAQPPDAENIMLEPPRGVYFADEGVVIRVGCVSRNDNWLFREWSVGTGSDGVRRIPGTGEHNTVDIELTQDTVVIASHSYNLT